MGSVDADDERQIAVADDWKLHRLAHSSSTNTAAPCPGDIGRVDVNCTRHAGSQTCSFMEGEQLTPVMEDAVCGRRQ